MTDTTSARAPFFPENLDNYAPWVAEHGLYAPYGECQCGCGQIVPLAAESRQERGHRKGEPHRCMFHHVMTLTRPVIVDSSTCCSNEPRLIALSKHLVAIVDADDYEWLSQWKWFATRLKSGNTYYAEQYWYSEGRGHKGKQAMHRVIMNPEPGYQVDHINGNGLDNRRVNLRICTPRQNSCNVAPQPGKSSRFKGVGWCKRSKKWRARIRDNGKFKELGEYTDEMDAARAYDKAAREIQGEFAWLNFDNERETTL